MTTRVLRFPQLGQRGITYTRKHIRHLESENKFPRRVQLGPHSVGWIESEVEEWLRGRPRVVSGGSESAQS